MQAPRARRIPMEEFSADFIFPTANLHLETVTRLTQPTQLIAFTRKGGFQLISREQHSASHTPQQLNKRVNAATEAP